MSTQDDGEPRRRFVKPPRRRPGGSAPASGEAPPAPAKVLLRPRRRPDATAWLEANGFRTLAEAAASRGLATSTARARLCRGAKPDEAFRPNDDPRGARALTMGLERIVVLARRMSRADPAVIAATLGDVDALALRDALDDLRARIGVAAMAQVMKGTGR